VVFRPACTGSLHTVAVRVGLALPQYEIDRDPAGIATLDALISVARAAERLGLDAVWLSDHPFALAPDGTVSGALEPLLMAGGLARETARIRIGTLVLAATMRAPALVAHTARTLPAARTTIGVGAGWYEPEHRAYGVALGSYPDRVARLEAALAALAGIGDGRPRILAGGTGERLLDLAARYADDWNVSWDVPADVFGSVSRRLDDACERAGRDASTIGRTVGLTVLVGRDEGEIAAAVERLRARAAFLAAVDPTSLSERIVAGTPERCVERIAAYAADEVVVALLLRDDMEMLELFATEVAPGLRAIGG
jgi:alkanesulfonate monooxygenase SsuD/methylene tetrahydromethanopterin reductase-like flavin-dependent oxidoreductase (luciferase family)